MVDESVSAELSADDADGLATGLAGLSGLVAGRGTLEDLLTEVATFTMIAVPSADGAGVTMLEAGQPDTIVASATFVRDVDAIQYRLGEGPCISAAALGATTTSAALDESEEWPIFGPLAADLGIHSALSLPLILRQEVLGALNVYAHERNAFDGSSRRIGEQFAKAAAVAVHNARVLNQVQQSVARMETAMANRTSIDRAVGILISRTGISADDAFLRVRIMSQHERSPMAVVAARIVEESRRSAQAIGPLPVESRTEHE